MEDGEQNCIKQARNQDNLRETKKLDNSNKKHEQRKNNESSTKQVELSYLKEEIKDIKRTLDIQLKRQWLETTKNNKEDLADKKKNQKIKQKQIKSIENNREQSINSNEKREKKQEKDKGSKNESITRKSVKEGQVQKE